MGSSTSLILEQNLVSSQELATMGLFGGNHSDSGDEQTKKKDIEVLVNEAEGDTVTKDILTKTSPESLDKIERTIYDDILEEDYFLEKNPIIYYLDDEKPQFIFHSKVTSDSGEQIYILKAEKNGDNIFEKQHRTDGGLVICFTNERIVLIRDAIPPEKTGIISKSQPDYTVDISYNNIRKFEFEWPEENPPVINGKKVRNQSKYQKLILKMENGTEYIIKIPRQYSRNEINNLIIFLKEKIDNSDVETKESKSDIGISGEAERKSTEELSDSELLHILRSMEPYKFEKIVANLWQARGWDVQLTSQSSDRGVDIIATKEDSLESRRHLIQAKKYGKNTKVSSEEIQRYAGLYARDEQIDKVFVVTSNKLTSEAREVAENRNIEPINAKRLVELIRKHSIEL